jgi:hypothetical protein
MNRWRWLSDHLVPAVITAWWNAWDALWEAIGDTFDPDYQRDERSRDRNTEIHELDAGGGFWAAGTGSDSD